MACGVWQDGIYVAAVTPFSRTGEIDFAAWKRLLTFFHEVGLGGVVVAGTTGEGPSLSWEEKFALLASAADFARSRREGWDVALCVSTPCLPEAELAVRRAGDLGADAVLLMPPGYFREAPVAGVLDWLEEVLDASPVPVIYYHFPSRSGVDLPMDGLARLARHERWLGIKDSSGDASRIAPTREGLPAAKLFVGAEALLPRALQSGWNGSISGAANVLGGGLVSLFEAVRRDDLGEAARLEDALSPVLAALRQGVLPARIRSVLHAWGLVESDRGRLPLIAEAADEVVAMLAESSILRFGG